MKKIHVFTHFDLDGCGSLVLLETMKMLGADIEYDYTICSKPEDCSKKMREFFEAKKHLNYDVIFVTDMSVDIETAKYIDKNKGNIEVKLYDHHKTALELNVFDWCFVSEKLNDKITCGTSMFCHYLVNDVYEIFVSDIEELPIQIFVESVRMYDTYDFSRTNKSEYSTHIMAEKLNSLSSVLGIEKFIYEISNLLYYIIDEIRLDGYTYSPFCKGELTEKLEAYLEAEKMKEQKAIDIALKYSEFNNILSCIQNGKEYKFIMYYTNEYTNQISHAILKARPELDFIITVNLNSDKISARAKDSSDIDLSVFMKTSFSGGGHYLASGGSLHGGKSIIEELLLKQIKQ